MNPRRFALLAALVAVSAGCALSSPSSDALDGLEGLSRPATTEAAPADSAAGGPTTTVSATQQACKDQGLATRSYRPDPDGDVDDPYVEAIRERGHLRVGVDQNTLGFSVRDAATGDYEGFEADLAREIAQRIFGTDYRADSIQFIPVTSAEKLNVVRAGDVDFTISANTMTCSRWETVLFSSEYYSANQELLVREESDLDTVEELAGARVCVTSPSSSEGILEDHVPDAELVRVGERIECLVALQEGTADAYFGHDSFQYGMLAQQPGLEMRPIAGLPTDVTESHYGIAIGLEHQGFVRFVNAVLEDVRADGTWQRLHEQLEALNPAIIPAAAPPEAEYRD